MLSLWFFFLRKRQFSWLVMFVLIGLGTYSLLSISRESYPEIIIPIGSVSTVFPGASGADVEELVTNKLEDAIADIDNIDSVTSVSQDGFSSIIANFDANADIDKSIQDLKDAVDSVKGELPRDANDPVVSEVNFSNEPIVIISVSSDLPPTEFTKLGEQLSDELKNVQGVSSVQISGTRKREIQVVVHQEALSLFDITPSQVSNALGGANLTLPVGTINTQGIDYAVRYEGKIEDVNGIGSIPVGTKDGNPVYIRDIATVFNNVVRESTISRVSIDGVPSESAMTVSVYKQAGVDVTVMSAAVLKKVEAQKKEGGLLSQSQVLTVFDQADEVRTDLSDLVKAGFETVALVILALLLTIGWRESLVAALSIPLSFVIAFIGLYASGNTINFISLFALILAVGILVDSGIVITEAIHTRIRKFGDPDQAAHEALREYAWPLIGGTMTTIAVFVPLFFISGIVGKFIAGIPFTIIFVLLASIVVALGMVPLIAIKLTKNSHSNRFEELQEKYTHKIQVWYRAMLMRFLSNRKGHRIFFWSLIFGLIFAFALPVTGLLHVAFFPAEDVDFMFIEVETKQGTPVAETDLAVRQAEESLYGKDYIASFTSTAGSGSAFTGGGNSGGKFGNITVKLKPERTKTSAEISAELRKEFSAIKSATISITEQQNGPPSGAPVNIKFFGENLQDLAKAVESAESLLVSIGGTRDITPSTKSSATELILSVDMAKASAAGVSPFAVGELLRYSVFGTTATTITKDGKDIDIVVKLAVDNASTDPSETPKITLDALKNLELTSITGKKVLLSGVVNERLGAANASITHEDKERVESVSAYTVGKVTPITVVNSFKSREAELNLPAGVRISYGGEAENVDKSFTEMGIALVAGLLLMLAILVLAFNSVRYSLYLLSAVPLSLIGVFFGLAATGLALSFSSLLGVIALAGVIINHAIILMDSMIVYKNAHGDLPLKDIVADAAVTRLRPIVLTTITTVVGMIPLSRISDFWSPLAYAIMFGLTFAMVLTLILIPTLYYRNEKKRAEKLVGTYRSDSTIMMVFRALRRFGTLLIRIVRSFISG